MKYQGLLLLIFAAIFAPARGNHTVAADAVPIQENFDVNKIYGEWHDIMVGTTCRWMKLYKNSYSMGTLKVGPGKMSNEISLASTRLKHGRCTRRTSVYQKTSVPGKFVYSNPEWNTTVETYVAASNYDEYIILVMKKNSTFGFSLTSKLYGRGRTLRPNRVAEFQKLTLDLGIPEDSIFTLMDRGECVPSQPEVVLQRVRRSILLEEEGSADGSLQSFGGNKEDYCLLPKDAGPCLGMLPRFFHNNVTKTCEEFFYGGCLGNGNNFNSERTCLQTCRTEAACRLPIVPGRSCDTEYWAFDASQGKCVTFRGCGGNANKFYLEKECKEYCGVLPDGEDEFLHLSPR
ncbi:protein AMBP [Tiliqua scincoides]|uniref:protein AMBP n=1 Tax=Tiliqua scincoides TaxID=71010 RepID=UPI00346280C2